MMNNSVQVSGLRVVRSGKVVLDDVGVDVPAGCVTGLIGPSGCGKTTLMRTIVGLQRYEAGQVEVLGMPAGHRRLRDRIGYVTQSPSVYGNLSVAENLQFFAQVLGCPASDVDRVVEQVGLSGDERSTADRLSGGQRNRLSLAIALLGDPQLLVLDEPTVGLDPVLRRGLWNLFRELADRGVGLLVSSHVMDEAQRCDSLVLLRDGRVVASGGPRALLDRTGTQDLESAFLAVIDEAEQAGRDAERTHHHESGATT
jgi:ABC-2 type transport system ATP-binding protein